MVYACIIILLSTPFAAYRIYWLQTSIKTTSVIAFSRKVRISRSTQDQPFFRYPAGDAIVIAGGNYNLPYNVGDTIPVRYNPRDIYNFKIDTAWGCWKDIIYVAIPLWLFLTLLFLFDRDMPQVMSFRGKKN